MNLTMDSIRVKAIARRAKVCECGDPNCRFRWPGEMPRWTPLQEALLETGALILDECDVLAYQKTKRRQLLDAANGPARPSMWQTFFHPQKVTDKEWRETLLQWRGYAVGVCRNGRLNQFLPAFRATGTDFVTTIPVAGVAILERVAATGVEAVIEVEQCDEDPFLMLAASLRENVRRPNTSEHYYLYAWDEHGYIPH